MVGTYVATNTRCTAATCTPPNTRRHKLRRGTCTHFSSRQFKSSASRELLHFGFALNRSEVVKNVESRSAELAKS